MPYGIFTRLAPFAAVLFGLTLAVSTSAAEPQKKAAAAAKSAVPPELIAAVNREGRLKLAWTGTGTDDWRHKFQDAFNEQYGV